MSRVGDLIPRMEPFERAAAAGLSEGLPIERVAQSLDPARAPARFVPWLAAGRGVRLWYADWSLERQRAITVQWPRIGAQIGTRAAVTALLPFVDAELIDVVSYPARLRLGRSTLRTPIGHAPFMARYLIRVRTRKPRRALALGRRAMRGRPVSAPLTFGSAPLTFAGAPLIWRSGGAGGAVTVPVTFGAAALTFEGAPLIWGVDNAGGAVLRTPSREPFDRALAALRVAKAPETQIRVSFQHKRPLTVADAPTLASAPRVGGWVDSTHL